MEWSLFYKLSSASKTKVLQTYLNAHELDQSAINRYIHDCVTENPTKQHSDQLINKMVSDMCKRIAAKLDAKISTEP